MTKLWNTAQLASELGFDRRTMANRLADLAPAEAKTYTDGRVERRWTMEAVFKQLSPFAGQLPVAAGVAAAIGDNRPEEIDHHNAAVVRMIEEARLARARADDAELRVRQTQGELIPVEFVVDICTGLVLAAKAKMQTVHRKLAARYPDLSQTVLDSVEDMLHEACEELGDGDLPPELAARVERYREQAV